MLRATGRRNEVVMVTPDLEIDASGLACPMPLLKAKQGLNELAAGQYLRLLATDPGSVRDIQAFANLSAHELVSFEQQNDRFVYVLRKAKA